MSGSKDDGLESDGLVQGAWQGRQIDNERPLEAASCQQNQAPGLAARAKSHH